MRRFLVRCLLMLAGACTLGAVPVLAGDVSRPQPLRPAQIFAPEPLTGRVPSAITWAPDGSRFLYTLPGGDAGPLDTRLYDVRTHRDRLFFRAASNGKGSRPAPEFVWSPDGRQLAYLDRGDLWLVGVDGSARTRLARAADDPQWSPDGSRIAYVHANDLYAITPAGGRVVRFSSGGTADISNGDPDWVYSEELDMRHAYRWSPNGSRIAYLRFDQRPIAQFPIVDFLAANNSVEQQRYPLAGQRNSAVSLLIGMPGGASRLLYSTKAHDDYLASVGWTPGGRVVASILDRSQKRLRYVAFSAGHPIVLGNEADPCWVDFHGAPQWLPDKHRFVFISDRAGEASLYVADPGAGTVKRLTHGYPVESIAGIDEKLPVVLVSAAYPTRRDTTVLVIPLGGGLPRPLAGGPGSHDFVLAANARNFVRSDSAFGVPPTFTVGSTLGGGLVPFAHSRSLAGLGLGAYRLGQIDSVYGKLDTFTIEPPDFDPTKRYPVIEYVYGGPAAPTTGDRWGGATYLFHQALAQRGYIVFSVDGPGSQIDSAAAVRRLYHRLGPASLAGQLAGADYLTKLPFVDAARIGLWGWSFGGYEVTYAMTHAPHVWKVGVAVAPVTDWSFYDSIYTERYMGMPQEFGAAYRTSSSVARAGALAGHLLISHGTADDNVHIANSIALLQAFILAGKQADFMVYPRKTHSIAGIAQRRHLFDHMLDYWQEHL